MKIYCCFVQMFNVLHIRTLIVARVNAPLTETNQNSRNKTKKTIFEDFLSRKKTELGGLKNTSYNKLIGGGGPYLKFDQAYLSKQCAARTPLIIS
jgi:hypothetical protein